MTQRILIAIALLATATFAQAEDLSPLVGPATQEPVQIAIDSNTGVPVVADVEQPQPVVAARE